MLVPYLERELPNQLSKSTVTFLTQVGQGLARIYML
jgi:hypothetical protein